MYKSYALVLYTSKIHIKKTLLVCNFISKAFKGFSEIKEDLILNAPNNSYAFECGELKDD